MKETEQQVNRALRHVDNRLDARAKLIVLREESGLPWQIDINRLHHAAKEKLDLRGRIEKPIEIARVVQNPHVSIRRWLPLDHRQQTLRIALQHGAVFV